MTTNLANLQMPLTIPVNSTAITISTCFAEEASKLTDLKSYFEVHRRLIDLLDNDTTKDLVNWFDGACVPSVGVNPWGPQPRRSRG
jgi:hypothetical protein